MLFDEVGTDWRDLLEQLRRDAAVLVVDDEPVVCGLMRVMLSDSGYSLDAVHTAEEAWDKIQQTSYDLLIADKNLPGESGVDLLARIRAAGIDLPSVMITGYPSVESVANALSAGASDYISKPFDDVGHVRNRLVTIVERRLQARLYSRIVRDLASVVTSDGSQRAVVDAVGRELFRYKSSLNDRPDVLVVAPSAEDGHTISVSLKAAGLAVSVATDREQALAAVASDTGPLTAIVSFDFDKPVALVAELKLADPLLTILVASTEPRLDHALAAVQAGASDFFMRAVESMEALDARTYRAMESSHRSRLYLHLIAILHRVARERGHPVADTLFEILPLTHREYLEDVEGLAPGALPEVDVDLTSLFDDIVVSVTPPDRRAHPRLVVGDISVRFRPADSSLPPKQTRLRDISRGGLFIPLNPPQPRGTLLEIELAVDGEPAPFRVQGTVVRTVLHDPDPDELSGCGVLLTETSRQVFADLVARLTREAAARQAEEE